MTRFVTLTLTLVCSVFLASMLHGCGDSATSRASGTYELDRAGMKSAIQAEIDQMEDPSEKFMATGLLSGVDQIPSMTFVLAKDGTFEATSQMGGADDTASGTWTVEGSTVTFRVTDTDPGDPEQMTGTLKGDSIELNPLDGAPAPFKLLFKKQKA